MHLRGLTARECEVVMLAADGLSCGEIAERLVVTPSTVTTLLARARAKLGGRNVRELMAILFREGLIRPEELQGHQSEPEEDR